MKKVASTHTIELEDLTIRLTRKNMRSLRLSLSREGEIRLSVPLHVSDSEALRFLDSKQDWIRKHLERIEKQLAQEPEDFSSIRFLGENHPVEIQHHTIAPRVLFQPDGRFLLVLKPGSTTEDTRKVLDAFYRSELRKRIEPLVREWEPIMGVEVKSIQYKRMKTRWGTCNVLDHRIWFNTELAKHSFPCMEYLVVHEMCHLLERGHGPRFKACMDRFLPHWRELKQELNGARIARY